MPTNMGFNMTQIVRPPRMTTARLGATVERGFALPAAIFVLVALALLVAAMNQLHLNQVSSSTAQLQHQQTLWAARSGLEWGLHQSANNPSACFADTTLTINELSVEMRCSLSQFAEASTTDNFSVFQINAEATTPTVSIDNPDYSWRKLTAKQLIEI